jgi:hypothetical protein
MLRRTHSSSLGLCCIPSNNPVGDDRLAGRTELTESAEAMCGSAICLRREWETDTKDRWIKIDGEEEGGLEEEGGGQILCLEEEEKLEKERLIKWNGMGMDESTNG